MLDIESLVEKYSLDYAASYGEPGYSLPEGKKGILFGDWNDIPKDIQTELEKDYGLEWIDEWVIVHNNNSKAYRTQPNGHGWHPYYAYINDEPFGGDEIEDDPSDYLDSIINDPTRCNIFKIDLAEHGFERLPETYETGIRETANLNSPQVLEQLRASMPDHEFIFDLADDSDPYAPIIGIWKRKIEE